MYKTKGIIIKKTEKGESDNIITVFTEDYGKLILLARGIRKSTSKLSSHSDLFSLVELNFVLGRKDNILTSVIKIDNFNSNKRNLKKIKALAHISYLVDRYFIKEERDDEIFNLFSNAFSYLEKKERSDIEINYFLRYFEFRFLSILGYAPKEKKATDLFSSGDKLVRQRDLNEMELLFLRYLRSII